MEIYIFNVLPFQHHDHIKSRTCLFSPLPLLSNSSSRGSTTLKDHTMDRCLAAPSPNIDTTKQTNNHLACVTVLLHNTTIQFKKQIIPAEVQGCHVAIP